MNIMSLENSVILLVVCFCHKSRCCFPPQLAGWKQPASMWRGPRPNLWISKWHYVRAALIQTGLAKHANTGYSAQH